MKRSLTGLLAIVVLLVPTAPAAGQNPIDDYRRNGTIDPCKYTDGQLRKGLGNLPPDVEQYAPGLADSLNQGREGCGGANRGSDTRQSEAVPTPAAGGTGGGGGGADAPRAEVKAPPSPVVTPRVRLADLSSPAVAAEPGQGVPAWVTVLVLIGLLVAAIVAAIRVTGADTSRVTRPLGTAFRDIGERSGDAAADIWDRVRLGR